MMVLKIWLGNRSVAVAGLGLCGAGRCSCSMGLKARMSRVLAFHRGRWASVRQARGGRTILGRMGEVWYGQNEGVQIMTIQLPEDLERYVRMKVQSGRFGSEAEAICEAVRLLRQQEGTEPQAMKA